MKKQRSGIRSAGGEDDCRILCHCASKTAAEIREAVEQHGLTCADEVAEYLAAGSGCSLCRPDIEKILDDLGVSSADPAKE